MWERGRGDRERKRDVYVQQVPVMQCAMKLICHGMSPQKFWKLTTICHSTKQKKFWRFKSRFPVEI